MNSLTRKIGTTTISLALLSSIAITAPETSMNPITSSHHEAQAATKGFKYFTTVNTSTAASDFATKSVGYATAGAIGGLSSGVTGAVLAGTATGHLGENVSKLKTVYITDKQYINKVGQIEHHATLYKNKSKTKKIGTAKWVTSTTYPNGNKEIGHK
ncbi:hypothetical protein [Staphylococcus succinus]|uniref:hypothetical protein n=1 Tax=Staphylococcus succinus TaxID=61015 RepID=UPI000E67AB8D|nr:hypothetical protein [Staphylococcus succinus]RIN26923.1 hypothetical protein BU067_04075 [Staphylococcus succinus]RIN41897.1 hypothetical protein BU059_08895 [Staphylococcus succinus]